MIKRLSFPFWFCCAVLILGMLLIGSVTVEVDEKKAQTKTKMPFTPTPIVPGRMAFVSSRDGNPEIYLIDLSGKNLRNLSNNPADDTEPAWSPDGAQIAFTSTRDGSQQIYTVGVDATALRRLTDAGNNSAPSWSPDATQLPFISNLTAPLQLYLLARSEEIPP